MKELIALFIVLVALSFNACRDYSDINGESYQHVTVYYPDTTMVYFDVKGLIVTGYSHHDSPGFVKFESGGKRILTNCFYRLEGSK